MLLLKHWTLSHSPDYWDSTCLIYAQNRGIILAALMIDCNLLRDISNCSRAGFKEWSVLEVAARKLSARVPFFSFMSVITLRDSTTSATPHYRDKLVLLLPVQTPPHFFFPRCGLLELLVPFIVSLCFSKTRKGDLGLCVSVCVCGECWSPHVVFLFSPSDVRGSAEQSRGKALCRPDRQNNTFACLTSCAALWLTLMNERPILSSIDFHCTLQFTHSFAQPEP